MPSDHWATQWVLNLVIDRTRRVQILPYSLSAATENSSSPIQLERLYVCVSESENMPMKTELRDESDHPSVLVKLPVYLGEPEDTHGST